MKYYNLTLIKTGSQEQIQYWESPEPKQSEFMGIYFNRPLQFTFENAYKKWKESVKTLDVHPSAVEEIDDFAYEIYKKFHACSNFNFGEHKRQGISLSGIEDRLEIKCTGCDWDLSKPLSKTAIACCPDSRYYFHLQPIPSKEEETLTEMNKFIKDLNTVCDKHKMPGVGTLAFENIINNYFNITRK